jgi:rhodanese-related sulfurtransferase
MADAIRSTELRSERESASPPLLIDVRREPAFRAATEMVVGAVRRDPAAVTTWGAELPRGRAIVVYCARGHDVSQGAARALRQQGLDARFVEGGIEEGWKPAGGALLRKPADAATRWVTRERPKIDRIACPWLIARFIDAGAEFLYVPPARVAATAAERAASPYDVPDVPFSHDGERCTFDALVRAYALADPALERLATIVRGADTGRLDLAPQCAGLLALSLGLSRRFADDHEMLRHGMTLYDALWLWCRDGNGETHGWNPAALRDAARGEPGTR